MKATFLITLMLLAFSTVCRCQSQVPTSSASELDPILHYDDHVYDVSMIQLIANPDKYAGKRIRVQGYFALEFEGIALYLHQDDYNHAIFQNSLWVNLDDDSAKQASKCSKHYVMVEATFTPKDKGHMGVFGGGLSGIKDIRIWP